MKSIQKLLAWLVPIEVFSMILSITTRHTMFNLEHRELIGRVINSAPSDVFRFFESISLFTPWFTSLIIGVWLFSQAKSIAANKWLWLVFGIAVGYWALGIWLLVRIPGLLETFRSTNAESKVNYDQA